ncbi:hypothetical protein D3877_23635 [Azospirillum cavernae]|uniref:Uncharacterized protein n=1 Tax=Azospirillum cavernae TaxID=2320860 RepID=A0A418VPD5_9PROT|nr:hypothetical protein [Azospirillum cavernae]RJF78123.1 hypothetical protein D3877_23635 [Azospirillum cavernae]
MTALDPVAAALASVNQAAAQIGEQATAQAAAAQQAAAATAVPAVANTHALAPVQPGKRLSMDDALEMTGMAVEAYLNLTESAIQVGKVGFHEKLVVGIDITEVQPFYGVSWGNPAKYGRSYDRVLTVGGGSWAQTLQAASADPAKAGSEYISYEIPMTVVEAGTVIGFSPSVTNAKDFKALVQQAKAQGLTRIKVELTHKLKTNTKGKWGSLIYKLVGEWEEDGE